MKKYYLALDLVNDAKLIKAYEELHKKIWIEVIDNLKESGIVCLEIYRVENRLVMVMEVNDTFSFERKQKWMNQILLLLNGKDSCGNTRKHYLILGQEENGD